jgi:O-antigen ligase
MQRDPLGHRVHLCLALITMATILLSSSLATISSSLLIGYAILRAPTLWRTWRNLPRTPMVIMAVALYAWLAITLSWSPDTESGTRLLRGSRYLLLIPALIPMMLHARLLLWAVVFGVIIQCVAQLTAFLAGWTDAPGGLSGHPGHTGLWFSLGLGALILMQPFQPVQLIARVTLTVVAMTGLVATEARSAIAGTMLGLVAGTAFLLLGIRNNGVRLALAGATVAVLVLGILIGSQTHVGTRINQAYTALSTPYTEGEFAMDQTRPLWWRIGLSQWREHPIIGAGIGSAKIAIPENPEVLRILEQAPENTRVIRDDYHSLYVTTLADAGLVGFGLLVAWLATLGWRILGSGMIAPILLVGLVTYLGYGFFNTTLFSGRLVAFAATLMAFSVIRLPEQMKISELPK